MTCFKPIEAWQTDSGDIKFVERGKIRRFLELPCGQCVGCRLERSRQWATRIMHEASLHDFSSFVTLTYNDENCPVSLSYRPFQLFMKRLRRKFGPVRFYMCGEYGENFERPHFHAILFGLHFADRVVHSERVGARLYRSPALEGLWPDGFSSIGDVTFDSAAYVARYCMKKVTGPNADAHYERVDRSSGELVVRKPEFARMSLRPGIGAPWFDKFRGDVFGPDRDYVVANGVKSRPPRFYDKRLETVDPDLHDDVVYARQVSAGSLLADRMDARLAVRERVTRARLSFKKRSLE
ncbi:MAG: replication initiator protein [Microvirus sp.]|nr:MAG: replication initiator protein [Microvirus sp.]